MDHTFYVEIPTEVGQRTAKRSWMEKVEIIARDNEVSILRKEDISKAYLGCHTDITIPYDELDKLKAKFAEKH